MNLPKVNKKNFKKVIKEFDIKSFPSFIQDKYLNNVREKLINRQPLLVAEELISFARLTKYVDDLRTGINKYYLDNLDFSKFKHRPLLPYQEDGVKFLIKNDKCILADDTGLGKSSQVIAASLSLQEDYKVLIVTKKTLKYNFEKEIFFYIDSCAVIEKKWVSGYKFTIVSYEGLIKFQQEIINEQFDIIIADECQAILNPKSKRSLKFAKVVKDTLSLKKLWLLTGTPISNRPLEFFSLLKLVKHPLSKNWQKYVENYCDAFKDPFGFWNVKGASNLDELHTKTKDIVLRRLKKDHLKELPNKYRQPIFLKLLNKDGYNDVVSAYQQKKIEELDLKDWGDLFDDIGVNEITKMMLERQFCALEKIEDDSLIDLIKEEISEGKKVLVFTNFTKVVDKVYNHFTSGICRFLDGRIDGKKRLDIVDEFNNNTELRILVCNLQVGSMGLNVQSASSVIVNDMFWAPGIMLQAEDRAWRYGQESEVTAKYLIYRDTIEEMVYNIINEKMTHITQITEGKSEGYFIDLNKDEEAKKVNYQDEKKSIIQEILSKL